MKHSLTLLVAAAALAGATVASAAGPRGSAGSGIYQQEVSVCGHNQQDRTACIREAGAARQAAARGDLTTPPDYRANAMARCARQEASDRMACEARVTGAGRTTVEGSVMGGGLIYETVTPLPPR